MSKYVLVTFIVFAGFVARAQTNWLKSYGSFLDEVVQDASADASGNIISVGYFFGNTTIGSTTLTSAGGSDIVVMKTDNTGNPVWAIKAGGAGPDKALSVSVDNAGNSYITGSFSTTATFGSISVTTTDKYMYAAKIDPNGNFLWVQTFGGQSGDSGYGIEVDNAGNVLVTGKYKGNSVFGSDNFTSTLNPISGLDSYDFFLTKLDPSGNFLWTREANAKYDDKGLALTVDEQNNIYVVGQFSDTITFQNVHNNQSVNVGFVIKYDDAGNEIWFNKYSAAQVVLNDIKWDNNDICLTGDFKGNMELVHQGGTSGFSSAGEYKIFLSKLTESGNSTWFTSNFSENEVSSKQLAFDSNHDIYLAGLFRCDFTEMNQEYGNSTFLSWGYRDVHYIKYSSTGNFQWARQFGGREDDFCSAIVVNSVDHPVLAGSYIEGLKVPAGANFDCFACMDLSLTNCGDTYYGRFAEVFSTGSSDIFMTDPFDITRSPFDYHLHETACDYDTTPPCIGYGYGSSGTSCYGDTVEMCYTTGMGGNNIGVNYNFILSPLYTFLWNDGGTDPWNYTPVTGDYSVQIIRMDGCFTHTDSIHVIIHPLPAPPLITDSWGYAYYDSLGTFLDTCYQDSLYVWATPNDSLTDSIAWFNGIYINDSTIHVTQSGNYVAYAYTSFGCMNSVGNVLGIDSFALHDVFDPVIYASAADGTIPNGDTLYFCSLPGNLLTILLDQNYIDPGGGFPNKSIAWYLNGVFVDSLVSPYEMLNVGFSVDSIGWYTIGAHLVNDCGDSVDYYVEDSVYVKLLAPYVNIIPPDLTGHCIGDTLTYVAITAADTVFWLDGYAAYWGDSVGVILSTQFVWIQAWVDTVGVFGTCTATDAEALDGLPVPEIQIVDVVNNGGSICPGDSLQLYALTGNSWIWISPEGDTLGYNQNLFVTVPGLYYCLVTENGCEIPSAEVEAKLYSSPSLEIDVPFICEGEVAEITVVGSPFTTISWLPPLSGSDLSVFVDSSGTYYCETSLCYITAIDSVILLVADPIAEITAIPNGPACEGDDVVLFANPGMSDYSWNDSNFGETAINITSSGTFILNTQDAYGCEASDTLSIDFFASPPAPVADDVIVCQGDTAFVIGTVTDTLFWYDQAGVLIGTDDTLMLPDLNSDFTVYLQTENLFCSSLPDTVLISFYAGSTTPVLITDSVFCENEFIYLQTNDSTGTFNYNWILPDNSIVNSPNLLIGSAELNHSGTYSIFFNDANCTSDTMDLVLQVNPLPDVEMVTPSQTLICLGDSLMLEANTNTTDILWSDGITTAPLFYATNAGLYYYTATVNGCSVNSDSFLVSLYPMTIFWQGLDETICEGEFLDLVLNTTGDVFWYDEAMNIIGLNDSFATGPLYADTTYYYQVQDSGFCATLPIEVEIHVIETSFTPGYSGITEVCQGDTLVLHADNPVGHHFWLLNNDTLSFTPTLTMIANDAGDFNVELVTALFGCYADTAFIPIHVNGLPQINLPADSVLCFNEELVFNNGYDYWLDWVYTTDSLASPQDTLVIVTFTGEQGCFFTDTIRIHYISCSIFLPNVFTPNGDGINDELLFSIEKGEILNLTIVNRWGLVVFEDSMPSWDGIVKNGTEAVTGTYFYILEYRHVDNSIGHQQGSFFLQR